MTPEEMEKKYREVMGHSLDGKLFDVRLWDGMDGCWTDCNAAPLSKEAALTLWFSKTSNGTKATRFSEIDYYRIYPSTTVMKWDGSPGRELFRDP